MTEIKPHAAHWGYFDAVVEDGRVTGVRPFGRDPFPGSLIQAVPDAVHSAARIDRPHVRKGWLEGKRRGVLRGGDPFVPVSWDRVTRLLAEETARVRAEHGPTAIYGGSYGWSSAGRYHHAKTQLQRFLGLGGGFTTSVNAYSYATGQALLPHLLGTNEVLLGRTTDWAAIARHAKLMLCFGGLAAKNGMVTSGGAGQHAYLPLMRQAAAAGVRFVNISPYKGDTEDALGAEWVPIRPGTDAAMMLAMAHAVLAAGQEDRGYLATHCVGWEKLRPYITGESDGTPKTPEWAASITGVPAATITRLALECAAQPCMLTAAWSLQRADYGEQPYWMLVALAAMLGRIGRPGQGVAFGYGSINGMGTPRRETPTVSTPAIRNPVGLYIPVARVTEMLERPGEVLHFNGNAITLPDIRLIWWAGGNPFHHHQDLPRFLRAWSRAETIVVQEPWWTALARHADIVLPATTTLERNDIACAGRDRFLRAMHQAIPPVAQARNDVDMLADIAEALGYRDRFTEQRDEMGWLRHLYDRFRQASAATGFAAPSFDEFWAAGHLEVPDIEPGEEYTQFAEFAADPEANPLDTPSGKVELFSETIASFNYADCPGHPVWIPPREWLGAKAAADYPLHLLSFQPATRLHGQLDTGRVAAADKIQGREPILMHPQDAAARGLAEGDIVRIFNARGACLGGVRLKPDILPGVVAMATGAWYDPLVPGDPDSICVHGNPNVLTADVGTSTLGQGPSAQSCLVQIEKWQGPLPPVTVHLPPRIEEPPA
ncbi:molybdopterin-dependent oxidoreductase [Siccirubricoccus sp. KC 17139]|uniref:Molybdopterin-dependent oxidoreductase n=1 Tax=Siccirubricoccus soli TaxID=2899147 RepID=A0ABT1D4Q6_9PROT|nr:molybdopterin-dependent oxidoreductase [Siccirubricoccus soli]MCO6416907.1 molybdopterin-dependent oxidoreductase [Siccirubricoccus soli]MCP2683042.1 molybdopterin-dependent oxidoreductase [Siccirubricoccus soli]